MKIHRITNYREEALMKLDIGKWTYGQEGVREDFSVGKYGLTLELRIYDDSPFWDIVDAILRNRHEKKKIN